MSRKFLRSLLAAVVLSTLFLSFVAQPSFADTTISMPLSTNGSQIVDATGKPILLRGVNWFGFEINTNVAHGLWVRDYKDMMHQIKMLGFNSIRLPYSLQSIRANSINSVDYTKGANSELQGLSSQQAMDKFIQAAADEGLLVLLDSHRNSSDRIPELWTGDGYTEQDWIDTLKSLSARYKNQWNVIGIDLKNEPHGSAQWGSGDVSRDWRLAAERGGNEVLAVAPNWLVVVEGVEGPLPGQQLSGHWWGGNLERAGEVPVRLSKPSQLVYSVHEYGDGVSNVPWFSDPTFPNNLLNRWQLGFYYLIEQKKAPVLVGEFGGRDVGTTNKEGIWQNMFVDYMRDRQISFMYWSWNPNSGDTGGILNDDWTTINQPKMDMLNRLLSQPFPNKAACAAKPDINNDGKVNVLDFSLLVAKFFKTENIAQVDLNCDGSVNVLDFSILIVSFAW